MRIAKVYRSPLLPHGEQVEPHKKILPVPGLGLEWTIKANAVFRSAFRTCLGNFGDNGGNKVYISQIDVHPEGIAAMHHSGLPRRTNSFRFQFFNL
jgi:hypothetical protein